MIMIVISKGEVRTTCRNQRSDKKSPGPVDNCVVKQDPVKQSQSLCSNVESRLQLNFWLSQLCLVDTVYQQMDAWAVFIGHLAPTGVPQT